MAGEPALNVVSIHAGSDPAGISYGMAQAFRRHAPDWSFASVIMKANYIGYPMDQPWNRGNIRRLWDQADVAHLHHNFLTATTVVRGTKPAVIHYHGQTFRERPANHLHEQRRFRAVGVVSTLDLYLIAPTELEWLPAPFDLEALARMREPHDPERIRIAHAPTNRAVKSTEAFLKAVHRLQSEGYPVDVELIENATWAECLRRKATADIYFDQVILGYGNNAVEAWGMGIPVIAGAADVTLDEMQRRFGSLPFYHATQDTIYEALREMVSSKRLRAQYAKRGLDHVRKFHDDRVVVEQLKEIYQRAAEQHRNRRAA